MTKPPPHSLLVGYDGSEPARAAVQYATERVGTGGSIYIVHATGPNEDDAERGRAVLDELTLEAPTALIDSDYELVLAPGPAAEALVETARRHDAREIVLGSRGRGRVGSLLGSVAQQVLHTADRPVVVIPHLAVREGSGAGS